MTYKMILRKSNVAFILIAKLKKTSALEVAQCEICKSAYVKFYLKHFRQRLNIILKSSRDVKFPHMYPR